MNFCLSKFTIICPAKIKILNYFNLITQIMAFCKSAYAVMVVFHFEVKLKKGTV